MIAGTGSLEFGNTSANKDLSRSTSKKFTLILTNFSTPQAPMAPAPLVKGRREAVRKKRSIYTDCFVCSANPTNTKIVVPTWILSFFFWLGERSEQNRRSSFDVSIKPLLSGCNHFLSPLPGEMSRSDRGVCRTNCLAVGSLHRLRKSLFVNIDISLTM